MKRLLLAFLLLAQQSLADVIDDALEQAQLGKFNEAVEIISPIYADLAIGTTAYENGDYQKAFTKFKLLAEQGHAKAQHNVGWMYKSGVEGIPVDDTQALYWYTKAAEQGIAESQYNVGLMYDNGEGTPQDYEQAAYWYTKAAKQGIVESQHLLGYLYEHGKGIPQDYEQAFYWYTKAAEQGFVDSQFNLGWLYENGQGVTKNYPKAFQWYTKAANQGNIEAQHYLGWLYFNGDIVLIDYDKVVYWWTKAAEQGDVDAQNNLGWMYANGKGVSKNLKKALLLYEQSAERGNAEAQYNLGEMYLEGEGVPKSYKDAAYWLKLSLDNGVEEAKALWDKYELWNYLEISADLEKAIAYAEEGETNKAEVELYNISQLAMNGDAKAMCEFGTMYMKEGLWIVQSDESAVEWWLKSANLGYVPCQFNIGSAYLIGKGIEKDLSQAKHWLQKAIDSDDEELSKSSKVLYGIHELDSY